MDEKHDHEIIYILCYTFSIIIIFITTCLIIIYVKTKSLHSYPCYFNILLSSVISLDNMIRLIKFIDGDNTQFEPNNSFLCSFQGFSLVFLDKLMLTTMTVFSIISYIGVAKNAFYNHYEKYIFIILTIISFVISIVLAILFMLNGVVNNEDICYVSPDENKVNKKLIDCIVTSILFVINFFCILRLLIKIFKIMKESSDNERKNYFSHFCKYIFIFILNNTTFIVVILIILNKFLDDAVLTSICYIILSLFIVLFYTVNRRVLGEGVKIICCVKEEKKNNEEEGIEITNMRSDSTDLDEEDD